MKFNLKNISLYRFRLFVERILNNTIGLFLFQYKRKDNLFSWFYDSLVYQHTTWAEISPHYNYYEFGVASGGSVELYILALKKFCKKYDKNIRLFHIYAFDSFQGLPAEQGQPDKHSLYLGKGLMSHSENEVLAKVKKHNFPLENFHMIKGYYIDSLTLELQNQMKSHGPSIVNIDCDYYSSTIQALTWMGSIMESGCLVRFDDIWLYHGHPEYGELKAINEFNQSMYGTLTTFPLLGLNSYVYVFAKKDYEYTK